MAFIFTIPAVNASIQGVGLGIITVPKILIHGFLTNGPSGLKVLLCYFP